MKLLPKIIPFPLFIASLFLPITPVSGKCQELGTAQIFWDKKNLTPDPAAPHTASFDFKFDKPFNSPPIVTNGINVDGSGHGMTVYTWHVNNNNYRGRLNNMYIGQAVNGKITMSYIAIGEPGR